MRFRLIAIIAVLLAALAPTVCAGDDAAWKVTEEAWYEMELAGARAGWSHLVTETDGTRHRTRSETHMSIGRGAAPIEITMKTEFVETEAGKPIMMASEQKMATQTTFARWEFGEDTVREITRQGATEKTREQPWPAGDWLTPRGVERFMLERIEAGAEEITFSMLGPESALNPIRVHSVFKGRETIEHDDRTIAVTVWETTTSLVPVPSTERVDESGLLVSQETNMGFGQMVMRLSSRERALDLKPGEVPELMVATFVEPNRPVEKPYESTSATLELRVGNGKMPELPSAGAQRVTFGEDGQSATLVVDMFDNLPASGEDAANDEYRIATTMVDGDDPLIQKLAARATRKLDEDATAIAKADALRTFVHRHISKKGLGTAFATASETAKTRTGDCSEHAVLLCAMLRAEEIPARVASGLVYADRFAGRENIFGWHMWTQALIEGHWVDLDATLGNRYNAAHVLTGVSSLAMGDLEADMSSMMMLIGNLEIDVVEVKHGKSEN